MYTHLTLLAQIVRSRTRKQPLCFFIDFIVNGDILAEWPVQRGLYSLAEVIVQFLHSRSFGGFQKGGSWSATILFPQE